MQQQQQQVKLEKVLGVTVSSNAGLACDGNGTVAYPAGCTVVLFNTRTEEQNHIINTVRKTITSLAYSSCGKYLVTGECGYEPAVRVWDLQAESQPTHPGLAPQPQQIAEFVGHKFGVNCVSFSPCSKYVVSVGTQHDMIVNVWDWRNNIKVASNKVSTKVKSIAFAENGSYFVTVGNRHVKFWYLEYSKAKFKEAVPLMGRSAILGEQRNNYFCDVACGKAQCGDSTYAITRSGLLCEFNNRRLLDKWVELMTTSANCIAVGEKYIFVGCADGIIRCFDPATLRFITTLPRTHYLGVDVSAGTTIAHIASPPSGAKYPDTLAVSYDESNHKLTSVYNDHSVYIWDVLNIKRVGKSFSFLYHSACIWGVEMAPPDSSLPPGSFLTCSSDDTIRVWTLDKIKETTAKGVYRNNVYSNELVKVIYVDGKLTHIKDLDLSVSNPSDKQQELTSYDSRNGVRCIRISPDGRHLASGDRSGNIRIHDSATIRELLKIEAHDAEVLCLEYSSTESHCNLMVSGSRDRLLHVFDVKNGYELLQTLDDHSSSITAIRFLSHSNNIQMVSCGADKTLIFRTLSKVNGKAQFVRDNHTTGRMTLYDMEVDPGQKHVLTACSDRNVRVYNVKTGRQTRSFKGTTGEDGTLIKVVSDRSGIYLATSCTDKSLSVYDYYSGDCMATMCGHSELATGLRFTNNCSRLISASGDGCIFVWKVPHDMVVTMHARLSQQALREGKTLEEEIFSDSSTNVDYYRQATGIPSPDYGFNVGQLPQWAKKKLNEDVTLPTAPTNRVAVPKGRWAQRFDSNNPLPHPSLERRFDSDGSKDSSLDSGTEIKHYSETRMRDSVSVTKQVTTSETRRIIMTDDSAVGDTGFESAAHDADIESDAEYRHRATYYPQHYDSPSGSEFPVTKMDADELRKSQRKKKGHLPQFVAQASSPTPFSQDSDDEEDDASTPSGENTDRNPMSLLSVSLESLDQLSNREKYLQSTFESMSGAENESTPGNKSSISSKFLTRSGERNVAAINAVMQTKSDPEANRKRLELNKRIAETKKKLESVGHSSPLRYSQSIHDLSHIPERDKWNSSSTKQGNAQSNTTFFSPDQSFCAQPTNQLHSNTSSDLSHPSNCTNHHPALYRHQGDDVLPSSISVPVDLQLCGCYMKDIARNTSQLSHILNFSCDSTLPPFVTNLTGDVDSRSHESLTGLTSTGDFMLRSPEKTLSDLIRPRKLKLDRTLAKYKLHKSLPVSPVSEERSFSDYVQQSTSSTQQTQHLGRKSFSYFLDFQDPAEGFKQICSDIEKFSVDFNRKYEQIEQNFQVDNDEKGVGTTSKQKRSRENDDDDGNFSSDSLEDVSLVSEGSKKSRNYVPPRRCVSNNEIYSYCQDDYLDNTAAVIPKSESFYLNQNINNSQDSILSDDNQFDEDFYMRNVKSYCNSMESILSNESDCKSAPLEVLFASQRVLQYADQTANVGQRSCMVHSSSLPKNMSTEYHKMSTSLPKNYPETSYLRCSDAQAGELGSHSQTSSPYKTADVETSSFAKAQLKTSQTQTDFATPEEIVAKKSKASQEFQQKLLKFETTIAKSELQCPGKKSIAFFIDTPNAKAKNIKNRVTRVGQENIPLKDTNKQVANPRIGNNGNKKPSSVLTAKNSTQNQGEMYIPTLESKNKQYQSKYCNILNNKPEFNIDIFETGTKCDALHGNTLTLTKVNFEKNTNKKQVQETTSLDRHLFTKSLMNSEKVCHKPPKAVRRHSSKTRKTKTSYEYVRKEDFYMKSNNKKRDILNNHNVTDENTIELSYKEKNVEKDLDTGNRGGDNSSILSELYDSLDKTIFASKIDHDSLEINLNTSEDVETKLFDSLEVVDRKNLWHQPASPSKNSLQKLGNNLRRQNVNVQSSTDDGTIQFALENIKILNEIQRKIHKINSLVDVFNKNMTVGRVRKLSSMYESMTTSQSFYNDLTKLQATPIKFRRRNLSLPSFVERRLNYAPSCRKSRMDHRHVSQEMAKRKEPMPMTDRDKSPPKVKDKRREAKQLGDVGGLNTEVYLDASTLDSNLRRSCSLSDLSMQTPPSAAKRKVVEVPGKKQSTSRTTSRYTKNNALPRSRSTTTLNHSDSDTESQDKRVSRLMRPTISSHNKMNKNLQTRKKQSYSTSNLNTVGIDNGSTSDDDIDLTIKPAVAPRLRLTNRNDNPPVSANRRILNSKDKAQVSSDLFEEVVTQLTHAADNVVELYNRLSDPDVGSETIESNAQKMDMMKGLEMSIIRTQKVLHDCIFRKLKQNGNIDVNQTDTVKKLNDLVSRRGPSSIVNIMEQYSEILLDMVQQKMHNSHI